MISNNKNTIKSLQSNINRKIQAGNIILVGMMGSGKTTMGRTLSKHLCKVFVDSDEEIQKRTGVSIPHIFDIEGEMGFRMRESTVLADMLKRDNIVLATGGGAVLAEQNRALLRQGGIVVYLSAGIHDLWLRTRNDRNRPLLLKGDPYKKLKELHQQRDPIYRQVADIIVQSGRQSAHNLMLRLVDEIETYRKTAQQGNH